MKTIKDTIIFSICIAAFVVGVHQTVTFGISYSYYLFMISIGMLFLYKYRKAKSADKEKNSKNTPKRKNNH